MASPITSLGRRIAPWLAVVALLAGRTVPASAQNIWNYIDNVTLPPAQQRPMVKDVVALLARGVVKTADDARFRPFGSAGPGRALASFELTKVTGLLWVETKPVTVDGLSESRRDLVWEVRVMGLSSGVSAIFWVSVRTGAVTTVFQTKD